MEGSCKYDVFISYSRKDYVRDGKPFEGNVVSKIMALFDANGISYWIDKKGIYSGLEFMPEIAKAISSSLMMVFVSSVNSNASKFTPGEVIEALNKDRTIIPIRIDATEYHDKFRIVLNSLDFIDYVKNPDAAMADLLRSVNRVKEVQKKKEQERQKAALAQEVVKSIKARSKKYQLLEIQQKTLLEEIVRNNVELGHKMKTCPVCGEELPLEDVFCVNCGWHFHPLEQLVEGLDVLDETRLALSRTLWKKGSSPEIAAMISQLKALVETAQKELKAKEKELRATEKVRRDLEMELRSLKDAYTKLRYEFEERKAKPVSVPAGYVDLGLPSGTLWKEKNETGFFTFDDAVTKFGTSLSTREQFEELRDVCKWSWHNNVYQVTGPNGNSIRLPAAGSDGGFVYGSSKSGHYWSSTPYNSTYAWRLLFDSNNVIVNWYVRVGGRSVRLVASLD